MSSLSLTASTTRFVAALLVCCGCLLTWVICTQNMADAAHAPLSTVATLLDLSADRHHHLWTWSGIAVAVLLIGVWITTLHRSLKRQARAELKRALEQVRELGELKSRFVTLVSHQFRTPLGIIMSAIELMRHYDDKLPPEQKSELQDDIHSATQLMASLMEQVLVLERVEAGKLGFRPTTVDIEGLATTLTEEILSTTHRRCPVFFQLQSDLPMAHADEALLRHIFGNLISNAVKYSPEGSPVHLHVRCEGEDAVFEVRDQGIGIPPEDLPQLYEAFFRGSNVGDTPGTGLGLVIVKRCADLHGGSIHLESSPGVGTTFTVRLPLFAPHQTSSTESA
jgi:signal transduction histidine kinase